MVYFSGENERKVLKKHSFRCFTNEIRVSLSVLSSCRGGVGLFLYYHFLELAEHRVVAVSVPCPYRHIQRAVLYVCSIESILAYFQILRVLAADV